MKTEIDAWWESNAENTLRLNYPLNEDSIVFDLGGCRGTFAEKIYNKYESNIYIFEPLSKFIKEIKKTFKENNKVRVFDYGVSGKTGDLDLVVSEDASYLISHRDVEDADGRDIETVKIKSFKDAYDETGVDKIDLMKINVEGAEYEIMQNIFDNDLVSKINNFQIQFHDITDDSERLVLDIREKLSETHNLDWKFDWVWENWSLK
tara:strand:- start:1199 stop:1816 length:618 start_codon:yes stop_codon:yes gene_type:complete